MLWLGERLVLTIHLRSASAEYSRYNWFETVSLPAIRHYARTTNATLRVVDTAELIAVPEDVERAIKAYNPRVKWQNAARPHVLKMLAIASALRDYRRVFWMDSDVLPLPDAADIFAACPMKAAACGHCEGTSWAPESRWTWRFSQRYFWGQNVTLNPSRYLNGGVIVWGQAARKVLLAPWIVQRIGDFFSALNDQHFIAATLAAAPQLRVHSLPREFDYMPYVVRRAFAAPDAHSGPEGSADGSATHACPTPTPSSALS